MLGPPQLRAMLQQARYNVFARTGEVRSLRSRLVSLTNEGNQRLRAENLALTTGEPVCWCRVCREEREDEWRPWMAEEDGDEEESEI